MTTTQTFHQGQRVTVGGLGGYITHVPTIGLQVWVRHDSDGVERNHRTEFVADNECTETWSGARSTYRCSRVAGHGRDADGTNHRFTTKLAH
jgi:hypothetical protein